MENDVINEVVILPNNNCCDERLRVISVAIIARTKAREWRDKFHRRDNYVFSRYTGNRLMSMCVSVCVDALCDVSITKSTKSPYPFNLRRIIISDCE